MPLIVDGTTGVTFNDSSLQGAAASPFGLKNRIINGDMVIDQRNNGASVTLPDGGATYSFVTDRWACARTTGATATGIQSSIAPAGFVNSLLITNGTGITVSSTGEGYIFQSIEGRNIADLGWGTASAATITLSFWVRSSITGTHSASLSNSANTRFYTFSYTISSANTWEQKSITIPGDTTGTWLTTNGRGINLFFNNGSGSTYLKTGNVWGSGIAYGTTGSVALNSVTGSTWYITGVQLERNTTATPFEWIPYGQELMLCQRYYYRRTQAASTAYNTATAFSSTSIGFSIPFPVEMRIVPTALEQTGTASNYAALNTTGGNISCSSVPTYNSATTSYSAWTNFTVASGLTAGNASAAWSAASSYLAWSAEL